MNKAFRGMVKGRTEENRKKGQPVSRKWTVQKAKDDSWKSGRKGNTDEAPPAKKKKTKLSKGLETEGTSEKLRGYKPSGWGNLNLGFGKPKENDLTKMHTLNKKGAVLRQQQGFDVKKKRMKDPG